MSEYLIFHNRAHEYLTTIINGKKVFQSDADVIDEMDEWIRQQLEREIEREGNEHHSQFVYKVFFNREHNITKHYLLPESCEEYLGEIGGCDYRVELKLSCPHSVTYRNAYGNTYRKIMGECIANCHMKFLINGNVRELRYFGGQLPEQ